MSDQTDRLPSNFLSVITAGIAATIKKIAVITAVVTPSGATA